MSQATRAEFINNGADPAVATLISGTMPDGTPFSLSVTTAPQPGAPNIINGQATAGAASGVLVAARATRRSVLIRNNDAANSCYVGTGIVSAADGFLLKAGEAVTMYTTAAVSGIRATADVVVSFIEEFD